MRERNGGFILAHKQPIHNLVPPVQTVLLSASLQPVVEELSAVQA